MPTAAKPKTQEGPFWLYKGHPLVRCGDTVYYGSLADPYIVHMKIVSTKKQGELDLADKVNVLLMSTDETLSPMEAIQQRCERRGMYNAIDIASIWLERALKKAA